MGRLRRRQLEGIDRCPQPSTAARGRSCPAGSAPAVHGYVSVCMRSCPRAARTRDRRVLSLSETCPFRCDGGSGGPDEGRTTHPAQASRPAGFFSPAPVLLVGWGGAMWRHDAVVKRNGARLRDGDQREATVNGRRSATRVCGDAPSGNARRAFRRAFSASASDSVSSFLLRL